jgi:hypothetical protein
MPAFMGKPRNKFLRDGSDTDHGIRREVIKIYPGLPQWPSGIGYPNTHPSLDYRSSHTRGEEKK